MKIERRRFAGIVVGLLLIMTTGSFVFGRAQHVRWDIISLGFTTPLTLDPGGFADATAPNNGGKIRLAGFGTFVAPAGRGGGSNAVTGGGTWQTFNVAGASTGSGTYVVRELLRFELANLQIGPIIDNIANPEDRANGWAYLRIEYNDGSHGVLGVFCHGPGAPDGIAEGINVTKGFVTYTGVDAPAPLVDLNRTVFHVHQ